MKHRLMAARTRPAACTPAAVILVDGEASFVSLRIVKV
jgi:hypothetical protein